MINKSLIGLGIGGITGTMYGYLSSPALDPESWLEEIEIRRINMVKWGTIGAGIGGLIGYFMK